MDQSTTGGGGHSVRSSLETSKLALVYPRQSSGLQLKENVYSRENQLKLVDVALGHGFPEDRVLVIEEDMGKSGRSIENRVGITRALHLIDQGLVGALYAEDQTRLSRDIDTVDHMVIAKRCRLAGVPIFMGGSWRDLSDRGTRLAYKVEAVIGSEMWGLHQEKMHQALRIKASKGQVTTRIPQYGYKVVRNRAKNDPLRDTLEVVRDDAEIIRSLADQLEEVGSLRQLARKIKGARWPNGSLITFGHLQKIFTKPIFRGHYVWGNVIKENAHEAIISPEQGARIDGLLARNKVTLRRQVANGPQLVSLVWCPACNRRLTTTAAHGKAGYICKNSKSPEEFSRHHFEIAAIQLDALVLVHLWRHLEGGLLESIIEHLTNHQTARSQSVDLQASTIKSLQRTVDGLTKALADPEMTGAARRVVITQLSQAAEELEAATSLPLSNKHIEQDIVFYTQLRTDREFFETIPLTWTDQPLTWRRSWVSRFVERVELSPRRRGEYKVVIRFRDGKEVTESIVTRIPVTEEELMLVRRLWAAPDRPRVWVAWMAERLKEAGYPRNEAATGRIAAMAGVEGRRRSPGTAPQREKNSTPLPPKISEEEVAMARNLWADKRRPTWGWVEWMMTEMAAAGYARSENGTRRVLKLAGIETRQADGSNERPNAGRPRPMIEVTEDELAAVMRLWTAGDKPKAWVSWMGDRLVELGFPRRASHSVRRLVRIAKSKNG